MVIKSKEKLLFVIDPEKRDPRLDHFSDNKDYIVNETGSIQGISDLLKNTDLLLVEVSEKISIGDILKSELDSVPVLLLLNPEDEVPNELLAKTNFDFLTLPAKPELLDFRIRRSLDHYKISRKLKTNLFYISAGENSDFKKKEKEINQIKATLKESQKLAKTGDWEWYPKENVFSFSEQVYEILEIPKDTEKNTTDVLADLVDPADFHIVIKYLHQLLTEKKLSNVEFRITTPKGKKKWILAKGKHFSASKEGKEKTIGIIQDITDRKKKERSIKETNLFLDSILENIPNMIFVKNAKNLRFRKINKAGEELLGTSRKEILGKSDYDFFPKKEADFFATKDKEVLSKGTLVDIPEEPLHTKNKGTRWLHTKKIPVFDSANNPLYLIGISEDITDKKKSEEALRESEEKFRALAENSPLTIINVKRNGEIIYLNRATTEEIRQDLQGKNIFEILTQKNQKKLKPIIEKVFRTGTNFSFEMKGTNLENKKGWFSNYVGPFYKDGKVDSVIIICLDFTERKIYEERLKKTTKDLKETNNKLERFSYIAAHDLKSPVINLMSLLNIVNRKTLADAKNVAIFDKIETSVIKLNGMLIDLLNVLTVTKVSDDPHTTIDFKSILKETSDLLSEQIKDSGILIKSDFHIVEEINHIPSIIRSIFQNLITNSIKYRSKERNPEIFIRSEKIKGYICLSFMDNGLGMNLKQVKNQIFKPFKRFHDVGEGKGLGLYILKSQVESAGGQIEVESAKNEGTTFKIFLKDYNQTSGE